MSHPARTFVPDGLEETYQDFPESSLATPFWDFYKVFWEAERRFDLPFRRDHDVAIWVTHRVRFYYDIARQLGLYGEPKNSPSDLLALAPDQVLAPLERVDLYVQTGATGPATINRTRPFGCVYTEKVVKPLLDRGASVLLLHDAPETLVRHPKLRAITTVELRERARRIGLDHKIKPVTLADEANAYWDEVNAFFRAELGVRVADPERLAKLIRAHKQQYAWHRQLLRSLSPNAMICMAHYFRAPQIEAARSLNIWTIDYQHGINSRYHLGYGYPHVRPEKRSIPYFPDEFWSWGKIWTDPDWFPARFCQVRELGHQQHAVTNATAAERLVAEKTLLIATSWAMQSSFRAVADRLATDYPDWIIRLKLHPRELTEDYAELAQRHPNVEVIPGDMDILCVAETVRYVLSICSSSLFDVLLKGCRIAVLKAPAAEYGEDFVIRYGVPVLEADGSNFGEVLAAMQQQDIPVDDVFHQPSSMDVTLLGESLMLPLSAVAPTSPVDDTPGSWFEVILAKQARRAFPDQGNRSDILSPSPWNVRQLLLCGAYRRFNRKTYDGIARRDLLSLDGPKRIAAFETAMASGLSPARHIKAVRQLIDDALSEGNVRATERLLKAVLRSSQPDSAFIKAELCEHWMSISSDDSQQDERVHARRWMEAAEKLAKLAPVTAVMAHRYREIAVAAREEFGDTRVSASDRTRLREAIIARLSVGTPFSMLRMGDGEVYAFDPDYIPPETLEADRVMRETLWWGRPIHETLRARLRREAEAAMLRADMLGIPSIFRLLRDMPRLLRLTRGPISTWPATARAHRIMFEELDRLANTSRLKWSDKALVDDRCHQELFTPKGLFDFLTPDRPRILVNCFTENQINKALGRPFFTHGLRLPPHTKVRDHVPDDALARAVTPDLLDDLLAKMESLAKNGAVFFVAGGFIGKVLIGRAAELGATALDVGAAADYWMGLSTRGVRDFTRF